MLYICTYVCIHIYIYTHMYVYVYIYMSSIIILKKHGVHMYTHVPCLTQFSLVWYLQGLQFCMVGILRCKCVRVTLRAPFLHSQRLQPVLQLRLRFGRHRIRTASPCGWQGEQPKPCMLLPHTLEPSHLLIPNKGPRTC